MWGYAIAPASAATSKIKTDKTTIVRVDIFPPFFVSCETASGILRLAQKRCQRLQRFGRRIAQPRGFLQTLRHQRQKGFAPLRLRSFRRRNFQNIRAASLLRGNDSRFIQKAIRPRDRIEINPQFLRQRAHSGQLFSSRQIAAQNHSPNTLHNLEVYRRARPKIRAHLRGKKGNFAWIHFKIVLIV